MDYPQSENEAKDHIQQIRREKGLEGPATNTVDLEAALILLVPPAFEVHQPHT
jgi:hypothetical protein